MYQDDKEITINKQDILCLLSEIDKKLAQRNLMGKLVICGGAAMALLYDARDLTYDIDAEFLPKENIQDFKCIIEEITRERNLIDNHWCNDDFLMMGDFCSNLKSILFQSYSNLDVYVMTSESLLAMKLISARPMSHDMTDAIVLMKELGIQSLDEVNEIFNAHFTYKMHQDEIRKVKGFVIEAFEEYQRQLGTSIENCKS